MDSEITSGTKNVPFIPPSSPPPIGSDLIQNDYDEFGEVCDPDDTFDITGLSQKLNICEANAKSSKLYHYESNDEGVVDTELQQGNFDKTRLEAHALENKAKISIPSEFVVGAVENLYAEHRLTSGMSPPPLNCIALPPQEDRYLISKQNFTSEVDVLSTGNIIIEDINHTSGEEKQLPMKISQFCNESDISSTFSDGASLKENSQCTGSENKITVPNNQTIYELESKNDLTKKDCNVKCEPILHVHIPGSRFDIQERFVGESLTSEISEKTKVRIDDQLPGSTCSSCLEISDVPSLENDKFNTCAKDISTAEMCNPKNDKFLMTGFKLSRDIEEENKFSFNVSSDTKVPSETLHLAKCKLTEFKSATLLSNNENCEFQEKSSGSHEFKEDSCHTAEDPSHIPVKTTSVDSGSEDEFGDFISNECFALNQTPVNDSSDLLSNSQVKNDHEQIADGNDDFCEFVSNDKCASDLDLESNYHLNQYCSSMPLPQIKDESDPGFSEFKASTNSTSEAQFDDSTKTNKSIFSHKHHTLHDSQESSEDEPRNFGSSPTFAVASDNKDYCRDKDMDGNSRLIESNNEEEEEEFGEFNCPETSTGLQLDFSDDEENKFHSGNFFDADSKITMQGTLDQTGAVDDKFRSLMIKWIPVTDCSSSNENISTMNVVKLSEVTEGDAFIWHHLEDIDSSLALKLLWPNSHINKLFLSSLNVDARNILFGHKWSSTIPVFAQTLSFSPLTPAKPSPVAKQWSLDENLALESSPPIVFSEPEKSGSSGITDSKESEKIIPPAQFDWSSSGLTNPLDASGLEEEILNSFALDVTSPSTDGVKPRTSSTPILEKILRESGPGPTQNTELCSLPSEVRTVVQCLPNLNFMRSKVLMFPLREGF